VAFLWQETNIMDICLKVVERNCCCDIVIIWRVCTVVITDIFKADMK